MKVRMYIREFPHHGIKVCIFVDNLIVLRTTSQYYKEITDTGVFNICIDRTVGVKTVLERLSYEISFQDRV